MMIVRKTLLAASAAALMSTPAWALAGQTPLTHRDGHPPSTTPVGPPSTTPRDNDHPGGGRGDHSGTPTEPGHPGKSHKCKAHKVAFVVAGTLVLGETLLSKNPDGTYSGKVTMNVTRTNHHAAGDKGASKKTYTVTDLHATFGLADTNGDGSVGVDDLKEGDSVKLIGKITTLAKRCDHSTFTAQTTIRKVIFHAPPTP
jgi:hypothetical protein